MRCNVNTIKELTDILVFAEARLANEGCRPRYKIDVSASEYKLVLHGCTLLDCHAGQKVDNTYKLLAQVIADFYNLSTLRNICVDGEVRIHKPHLVLELLFYTIEEILDVAANTSKSCDLLGLRKVHARFDGVGFLVVPQLDWKVLEVTLESSMLAFHLHLLALDSDGAARRDLHGLFRNQGLHLNKFLLKQKSLKARSLLGNP